MKTKICTKCKKEKSIIEFYKYKRNRDGLNCWCKNCANESVLLWKKNNPEKARECRKKSNNKYYRNNSEEAREYHKNWQKNNLEKLKNYNEKYRKDNHERISEQIREWAENNPERKKAIDKRYYENSPEKVKLKNKRARIKFYSNPKNRLSRSITGAIWFSLKGNKNGRHWEDLVGYNLKKLRIHLESLFKDNMTWNNYGKWHLDHKIPISLWKFNSHNDREFKQCWALCNLQPLWASENLSKRNKI